MSLPPPSPTRTEAEENQWLRKRLAWAELKIQSLQEELRLERIRKYGPSSEKLSDEQLQLLEFEPGVSTTEVEAESQREPLPETSGKTHSRKRKHPGRQELPADLPRVERVVGCPPEQCVCSNCGRDTAVIGYDESEQLDVEPAKYFVVVTRREKRACRSCAEGVSAAPLPTRIIDKSLVSDRIIIDTVVAKYSDYLPLYRQSAILERETGLLVSRATMDGWIVRVGDLLVPVAAAMRRELLTGSYIQADETPIGVQMHDGRGKNHKAYLWQYGRPGAGVVFDFRLGRGREGPKKFLDKFEGILQTDGYAAYEGTGGSNIVHVVCWSHVRRKFFEAVQLNREDRVATSLVGRIDELFAVDAEAREAGMDFAARHVLRTDRSRPLLELLRTQIESARAGVLPSSALGKAINYTLSLWRKLSLFLDHPEVELSNNIAENSMRPVVLGRKNWIHLGSEQAAPKIAAILSVVESCRRLKLSIRDYLASVLPGLASLSIQRISQNTPAAWAASRT